MNEPPINLLTQEGFLKMAFAEKKEHKLEIIPPHSIIQCREANIIMVLSLMPGRELAH